MKNLSIIGLLFIILLGSTMASNFGVTWFRMYAASDLIPERLTTEILKSQLPKNNFEALAILNTYDTVVVVLFRDQISHVPTISTDSQAGLLLISSTACPEIQPKYLYQYTHKAIICQAPNMDRLIRTVLPGDYKTFANDYPITIVLSGLQSTEGLTPAFLFNP